MVNEDAEEDFPTYRGFSHVGFFMDAFFGVVCSELVERFLEGVCNLLELRLVHYDVRVGVAYGPNVLVDIC